MSHDTYSPQFDPSHLSEFSRQPKPYSPKHLQDMLPDHEPHGQSSNLSNKYPLTIYSTKNLKLDSPSFYPSPTPSPHDLYGSPKHDLLQYGSSKLSMLNRYPYNKYGSGSSKYISNPDLKYDGLGSVWQDDVASYFRLQRSLQEANQLQEELNREKCRSFELLELKRRLEYYLKRMEFEVDKVRTHYQAENRQLNIRLANLTKYNSRQANQVNELSYYLKKLRKDYRTLSTQHESTLKGNANLVKYKKELLAKVETIESYVNFLRGYMQLDTKHAGSCKNTNFLLSINSRKSRHWDSSEKGPKGEDMERLYREFYKNYYFKHTPYNRLNDARQARILYYQYYGELYGQSIKPNFYKSPGNYFQNPITPYPYQQYSTNQVSPVAQVYSDSTLYRRQKYFLVDEISQLRDELVNYILYKCYKKSVSKCEKYHKNSLKLFSYYIDKNIVTLARMTMNYLELRGTIMEETGRQLPQPYESIALTTESEVWVDSVYKSVKYNARKYADHPTGYHLALFRLLTLLSKVYDVNKEILDNLKHTALKFVYKYILLIYNPSKGSYRS